MRVQRFRSVGLVALSYSMVMALLSAKLTAGREFCIPMFLGDGDCDEDNNNSDCAYDNGDCCQESCVDGEYVCGVIGGFHCIDPDYAGDSSSYSFDWELCEEDLIGNGNCDFENNSETCGYDGGDCCEGSCVDGNYVCGENATFDCLDPDYIKDDDDAGSSFSYSYSYELSCQEDKMGNGFCNPSNNNEFCGFDGGDCCSCTCPNVPSIACGGLSGNTCVDPTAPCIDGYVEAGTLTNVTVKASRFDTTTWEGEATCMSGGCIAELARDGDANETSRWSCFDSEYSCVLTFSFEEALDIDYVQVAFYRPDYYWRGITVSSNGVDMGRIESSSESTYTAFAMFADAVETLTFTSSSNQYEFEGFSLNEVRLMVKDPDAAAEGSYW